MERVVNSNVMWLGFAFALISFVHNHTALFIIFCWRGWCVCVCVCVCVYVCVCVSVCVCVCVYVRGASFKLGRPRSKGRKGFGRRRTGGGRSLKLGNFRWRHMCILPDFNESFLVISKFETFVLHELIPQIISLTSLLSKSPKDYIIHLGKCLLFEKHMLQSLKVRSQVNVWQLTAI